MDRQWNWPIALSLITATFVAATNLWFLSEYKPLIPFWELLAMALSLLAIVLSPLLIYFGIKNAKKWPAVAALVLLLACVCPGVVLAMNGRGDVSKVAYHPGVIAAKEIGKTKSGSPVYRFKIRLRKPPHSLISIGTSQDKYDRLPIGTSVEVPAKAGNLGIPWRVYDAPVNYRGQAAGSSAEVLRKKSSKAQNKP
jgi:hypothetical protein